MVAGAGGGSVSFNGSCCWLGPRRVMAVGCCYAAAVCWIYNRCVICVFDLAGMLCFAGCTAAGVAGRTITGYACLMPCQGGGDVDTLQSSTGASVIGGQPACPVARCGACCYE
jgi:ABC-type xylose transport system permease subunit